MITYHVRPAKNYDLDALFDLRRLAEQTFRNAGLDQWHDSEEGRRVIRKWVDRDEMNVVTTHEGSIIACFALSGPDQDFWTPEEAAEDALYIYKIIIRPDRKGSGVGEAILDYATDLAEQMMDVQLRVDCWQTNSGLHQYFLDRGFEHVDTRTAHGRNSGWLAQRHVSLRCNDGRVTLTDAKPQPVAGGDRYDDPISRTWQQARDIVLRVRDETPDDVGEAAAMFDQVARELDTLAREQRQANGMAHRPYTGA